MNLITPALGYRCTPAQMEQLPAQRANPHAEAELLLIYLSEPTHSLLSSLLISVEVYTQNKTLLFYSARLMHSTLLYLCHLYPSEHGRGKKKILPITCAFEAREMVQCRGEMEEDVLQRPVVKS